MGSKRTARRAFLRSGAALAGGFTLGSVAPAFGQGHAPGQDHAVPPSPPMVKGDKEEIAYGGRSKYDGSAFLMSLARPQLHLEMNAGLPRGGERRVG